MAKKTTARKSAAKKSTTKKSAAKKSKSAAKKTTTKRSKSGRKPRGGQAPAAANSALKPPPGGAAIRMYRIGHGDCFLIAFAGERPDKPAYVLIDCGYKPGSPGKLDEPTKVKDIGANIIETTDGFVDVAIVTHEHQDHVNGLTPTNFPDLKVGEVWFAWTENPEDDVANQLRKKFKDRLLGLIDSRASLAAAGNDAAGTLDWYLEFELGEPAVDFNGLQHAAAGGKDPAKSANKVAMKFLSGCAPGEPEYLYPHEKVRPIPGAKTARAFALGPPRDVGKIDDLDPEGDEDFGHGMGAAGAAGAGTVSAASPFQRRHGIPLDQVVTDSRHGAFFADYYGSDLVEEVGDGAQIRSDAEWRRLTADDAADAGALALAMNNATNNASLVLAFELSKKGKVLLFVGDAQAGNWRSWSDGEFDDDSGDDDEGHDKAKVTTIDLLGRTVVYKVGHHGSHNATMKGKAGSGRPSLAEMAKGASANEFVAMITAVEAWAHQKPKPDWNHPLPAIKQALVEKAGGRVLQTDSSLPDRPFGDGAAGWQNFVERVTETPLYFDLIVDP
jgi:hypothetical protein